MRLNNVVNMMLLVTTSSTFLLAGDKKIDYEKAYIDSCQICHGTLHQGNIGSDLRPSFLKTKDPYRLSSYLIDGVEGAMPSFISTFSKEESINMIDWLMNWEDNSSLILDLEYVNKYWTKLIDREMLAKKHTKPADVKSLDDITFLTERDGSLVTFIDSTSGKILSRHRAGYAVHVTIHNKKYPRYAYSISRSGRLTMFDLMASGQPAIAYIRVGEDSRGLAISNDGKYIIVGNYYPAGAVILDAMTLKAVKVFDTSSVEGKDGEKVSSKIAGLTSTPYGSYFAMVLKNVGRVQIIDYSKPDFPVVGEVKNLGANLHDAFLNEDRGEDFGRYYMVSSQQSGGGIAVIDFKEKKLAKKIAVDKKSKVHTGQGASWYSEKLKKQLHATADMGIGQIMVWDSSWRIVKKIKISDRGLFTGTGLKTPYLWADCVWGKEESYNEVHLIGKESLEVERIIKVGKTEGRLMDAKTKKVIQKWDATQYLPVEQKIITSKVTTERLSPHGIKLGRKANYPLQPKLLHAEPANYGKWMMISEWSTGRVGIYDAKSGKFIKYINNLISPTYTYSIEHRKSIPGS